MSSQVYAASMKQLQNTVREHRTARRLTQADLADIVGVSRQTIVAVEKGEYTPSALLALSLADAFGVAVEDVFEIVEDGD